MGLADAFGKDDRVELKVSTLLDFMTMAADETAKAKYLMNAVNCEVPYRYIREMVSGVSEDPKKPDPEDGPGEEIDIEDGFCNYAERRTDGTDRP